MGNLFKSKLERLAALRRDDLTDAFSEPPNPAQARQEPTSALEEPPAHPDAAEHRRALAALEKERNEALMIFHSAPVCIWYKDANNRVLRLNAAAARYMDREIGEVEGHSLTELVSPEAAAAYHADDLEVIRSGQSKLGIIETLESASGQVRWIQTDKVPYRDEAGQIIGVVVFSQDITGAKKAEEERLFIERQLQQAQKAESLGALAGGVAHDFNNLLTSVLGKVGLARASLPSASPAQRHLEGVETTARRAAELCRQMLAYSGHSRFDFEPLNLRAFIAEWLPLLRLSVGKCGSLNLEPGENMPLVRADPAQLRQLIINLVTNAAEACEDKSDGAICLRTGIAPASNEAERHRRPGPLSELPQGECVFLEVDDNGCGIPPEAKARVFDPFFTTKFTGRGLGLAAAAGIARGHGGALQVRSQPGRGTVFRLLLPISPGEEVGKAPPEAAVKSARSGAMLIVDDEEPIRLVTASMLEVLGFESLQAAGGAEALATYQEHTGCIAAVILDLTMPGMDGAAAFERFRRLDPEVRVIFMSSFSVPVPISAEGRLNTAFLQKPFTLDALRGKLHALLPS
jgi:two-component system cell cycle sensor histidine kinase/response regulator CckA